MTRDTPHSHPSSLLTSWSCVLCCEYQPHCPGSPSRLFCASFFPTSPMHLLAFIISGELAQQSANLSYSRHLYSQGFIFPVLGGPLPRNTGIFPIAVTVPCFNTLLNKDGKWVGKAAGKGLYGGVRPNHQPPRQVTSWISVEGP